MECKKVNRLLSGYVDGTLDDQQKKLVEKHLRTCKACTDECVSLQAVVRELGSLEHVEAPEDFLDKVHQRIEGRSGLSNIIRILFVPFRIKIPLQFATAAAMAVLVIGIFSMTQPEKQSQGVSSVSRDIQVVKESATDAGAPKPKKELYRSQPPVQAQARQQRPLRREPIELVLTIKGEREDAVPALRGAPETPATERKLRAIGEEKAATDTLERKTAGKASPKAGLRGNRLAQYKHPTPAPAGEGPLEADKEPVAGSFPHEAFSRVTTLIERADGRIMREERDPQTGRPLSLTAEVPTGNYSLLLGGLRQMGILQSPLPPLPANDQEMFQIRIQLVFAR